MKKSIKKVISILMAIVTIFSVSAVTLTASAANYSTNYSSHDSPENSGDYAYWNGKKVVKSSSTTKDEVIWIQTALNYCIKYRGLKASYLNIDGSFGPACKKATLAFQKAYGLSADGSFGPSTIKKMKSVLNTPNPTSSNKTVSTKQTNENGVVYTYITMSVDTSSMENWINSMKNNEKYVCNAKKGVIVEAKVTKTKTVTWKVSRAAVYSGPGIVGTVNVKYTVPSEIKYKVHSHTRNMGFGSSCYYAGGCIVTVYTCNCGYRKEVTSWEIPFPDLTDTSDVQTTKKIIQGLLQIN